MKEKIRRRFSDAVWIPLKQWTEIEEKRYGELGYRVEFIGVHSVAIHLNHRDEGEQINWSDSGRDHGVFANDGGYKPVDTYERRNGTDLGIELVLSQDFGGLEPSVWHLNQDLVFALRLLREGDIWVCPVEGYTDVVRLKKDKGGRNESIEIRSEFLRDYLAARSMVLRLITYRSRRAIVEDCSHIGWSHEGDREEIFNGRFEGRKWYIHEGGRMFDAEAAVFHVSRTDVDFEADVPILGAPNDENVASRNWTVKMGGRKLCHVEAEFWRDEWVEPAARSPRVREDKTPSTASFVIDASGERASADVLVDQDVGRWLWFSPQIVGTILTYRGASLSWYTHDTGSLQFAPGYHVHFGLNEKNLITVYAYDVARLPEWQRRIWAGFNVAPEGGVSRELLAAQVEAKPASTQAPERFFGLCLDRLNAAFKARWGEPLINQHEITPDILTRAHRFRAMDQAGLLALAKDLARLTADSFNVDALHRIVPLKKDERRSSLKSLERVLATLIGDTEAHQLMGPLVGVYDLRLGDAHMPSGKIAEASTLAGIDSKASWIQQGATLLRTTISTIDKIAKTFNDTHKPIEPHVTG